MTEFKQGDFIKVRTLSEKREFLAERNELVYFVNSKNEEDLGPGLVLDTMGRAPVEDVSKWLEPFPHKVGTRVRYDHDGRPTGDYYYVLHLDDEERKAYLAGWREDFPRPKVGYVDILITDYDYASRWIAG